MAYSKEIWDNHPARNRYIDFSDCETFLEVHAVIKDALELPDWYGNNLDALWDSITGLMYVPANITIQKGGANELQPVIQQIIDVFEEAKEEYQLITLTVLEVNQDS